MPSHMGLWDALRRVQPGLSSRVQSGAGRPGCVGGQAGGRARPGAKARGHEPLTHHRCSGLARLDLGLPLPSLIPGLGRTEEELPAESTRPETTPRSPRLADAPAEHPMPTAMCQLDVLFLHTARPSDAEGCETNRQGRTAPYGCPAETPGATMTGTLAGRLVILEAVWFRHRCGSSKAWLVSLLRPVKEGQ